MLDADDDSATRSPFVLGFAAAVGVALAYLLFRSIVDARDMLVLVGLSLFFAAGLDPAVRGLRRSACTGACGGHGVRGHRGVLTAFGFAVVPPLVDQTASFVHSCRVTSPT